MFSNPPMDYPYHTPSSHQWSIPPTYSTNPSFPSPTTPSFPSFPWELFTPYYTHGSSSPKLYLNHGYSPHSYYSSPWNIPPSYPTNTIPTVASQSFCCIGYSPISSQQHTCHTIPSPSVSRVRRNFEKQLPISHPCFKKIVKKIPKSLLSLKNPHRPSVSSSLSKARFLKFRKHKNQTSDDVFIDDDKPREGCGILNNYFSILHPSQPFKHNNQFPHQQAWNPQNRPPPPHPQNPNRWNNQNHWKPQNGHPTQFPSSILIQQEPNPSQANSSMKIPPVKDPAVTPHLEISAILSEKRSGNEISSEINCLRKEECVSLLRNPRFEKRSENQVEVSKSSCVDSNSGVRERSKSLILKFITGKENDAISEFTCVENSKSSNKSLNILSMITRNDIVFVSSGDRETSFIDETNMDLKAESVMKQLPYSSDQSVATAYNMFDEMPHRKSATWNASIPNAVQDGRCSEPIAAFKEFLCAHGEAKSITFLNACVDMLRDVGGQNGITSVQRAVNFNDFGQPVVIKYQLPGEDFDALLSVSCADDLDNMMDEYVNERLNLGKARKEAYVVGLLGENACGSGYDFEVHIQYGPFKIASTMQQQWMLPNRITLLSLMHAAAKLAGLQEGRAKVCEFCTALRSLVYCNADAAYLCISCDAKVHWANELSGRHPRILVCNSCKSHLAYVQCLDHKMLVCRDCDRNLHDDSSSHRRRAVKTFIGCPSAKEFAALWGFEFKEIKKCVNQNDQFTSDNGSNIRLGQIMFDDQERKTILQQIVDLKQFQLNAESDHSTKTNVLHMDEKFNQQAQNSEDFSVNVLDEANPIGEVNSETFSSAFSQLDNLSSFSAMDLPLNGELFWTYKISLQNNQLWSQNIQDLGICEEFADHLFQSVLGSQTHYYPIDQYKCVFSPLVTSLSHEMLNKGHGADSLVYNKMILGFLKLGNLVKDKQLFDEVKEMCLVYDGVVKATFMDGFFNQGRDKEGMDSHKSLMDRQFRMIPTTCNVLLEVLLNHGEQKEAWELFNQMIDNPTLPNFKADTSDTFNVMVNACFKLGKVDEAVVTFRKVDYTFTCISGVFFFILWDPGVILEP